MKKNSVWLSTLLALCLLAGLLAGCGSSGETSSPASGASAQSETGFAGKTEDENVSVFDFDVTRYVEVPDAAAFTLKKSDVDAAANDYYEELIGNYPIKSPKTEGEIAQDDIVNIYYKGTLVVLDSDVELRLDDTGITPLDAVVADSIPAGASYAYTVTLPEDFSLPSYVTREDDQLAQLLAGKEVTIKLTAGAAAVEKGTAGTLHVRFEYIFPGGTYDASKNEAGYALTIGSGSFIPGFESGMIGMSSVPGTKKVLELSFPVPYGNNPALAGERADFEVTVVSVTGVHYCDLSDAEDLAAFKALYESENGAGTFDYESKDALMAEYGSRARASLAYDLLNGSVKVIGYPEAELTSYCETLRAQIVQRYGSNYYSYIGRMLTEEEIITYFFDGDGDAFSAQVLESAQTFLSRHLTYYGVARAVGVKEPDRAAIDAFLESEAEKYAAAGYSVTAEDVLTVIYGSRSEVAKDILIGDLVDYLAKNVTVIDDLEEQ